MVEGRVCTICKEYKSFDNYHKAKSRKYGYHNVCKPCKSLSDKKSHQKHREKRIEYMSKRYEENKERLLKECKVYRDNNKESIAEYKKHWHVRNKESVNERSRVWREKNKEQNIESKKNWYRNNRDRVYANISKRRSSKFFVRFSKFMRNDILERDNWECQSCGVKVHDRNIGGNDKRYLWDDEFKAHLDHVIPISKGGDSTPENIQVLCRTCNLSKKAKTDYEIDETGQIKLTL